MKKRLLIFPILFLIQFGVQAQEVHVKDRALFRYENRVLYLSEVRSMITQLNKFRCLKKDWVSLRLTKLSAKDYPILPKLPFKKSALNEEREFINRYISLQKIKSFAKDQLVKIDNKELKALNKTKCFPEGYGSWSEEVKNLVKLEFYIKSRYLDSSKTEEEREQRLNSFFSTIYKKSSNVLFF